MPKEKTQTMLTAITGIILETIQEAGTKGIPSGHLYAALMQYLNIDNYNYIIDSLMKTGKVKQSNFLLTAIV